VFLKWQSTCVLIDVVTECYSCEFLNLPMPRGKENEHVNLEQLLVCLFIEDSFIHSIGWNNMRWVLLSWEMVTIKLFYLNRTVIYFTTDTQDSMLLKRKPDTVAQACIPLTWEAEVGWLLIQGHPGLHSKLETRKSYIVRLCLKNK
jgi:hypothetical protein